MCGVEQSKNKECKKTSQNKSATKLSSISTVYNSFILEL